MKQMSDYCAHTRPRPNITKREAFHVLESSLSKHPLNTEIRFGGHPTPTVFYIGLGKVGSRSLLEGFPQETVAHWHDENYVDKLMQSDALKRSGLTLFEAVKAFGAIWDYHPFVVEAVRDPIAKTISALAHLIGIGRLSFDSREKLRDHFLNLKTDAGGQVFSFGSTPHEYSLLQSPYATEWSNFFGADPFEEFDKGLGYSVKKSPYATCILLRFENISDWDSVFKEVGLDYRPNHANETKKSKSSEIYTWMNENFRISEEKARLLYGQQWIKALYTDDEREAFIAKWTAD